MKTFVPHKMCALSLNTQAKLDKQILRDKHDAILNAFVLDMKQMLIDKEFVMYCKEHYEKYPNLTINPNTINKTLYDIEILLQSTPQSITEYFNTCTSLVQKISTYLCEILSCKSCEA